ncbi:MAG: response regulator [Acidobacteria bacterium]|nr:response regulator [Acidobacteriota bacterium]
MRLLLALLCVSAARPVLALDPSRPLSLYHLDVYRDGLPQYTARTILQTSDGSLWLGTFEGLVRFDGTRFEVFNETNVSGVPRVRTWRVSALAEQPRGTLWIGTSGDGLLRYRSGTFTSFGTAEGLSDPNVTGLFAGGDGTLWIGTAKGLVRHRDGRFEAIPSATPAEEVQRSRAASLSIASFDPTLASIRGLAEDRAGNVFAGTGAGIFRVEGAQPGTGGATREGAKPGTGGATRASARLVPRPLPEGTGVPQAPAIESLFFAKDGALLVATTSHGLLRVYEDRMEVYGTAQGLPVPTVVATLEDSRGTVWMATLPGGLARLSHGRVETLDRSLGLVSNSLRSIAEDREGSLWIGTDRGLARLKDLKFSTFGLRQGLPEDNVRVMAETPEGDLWVGTEGGGVVRFDPRTAAIPYDIEGLRSAFVRSLAVETGGALWVGANGGLFRFEAGRLEEYGPAQGLRGGKVDSVAVRKSGEVLVSTTEAGLQSLRNGRFEPFLVEGHGQPKAVRAVLEDTAGTLWLGTADRGLLETRDGALVRVWNRASGLAGDNVFALKEDGGSVLVGTHDGLSRIRGDRSSSATSAHGLPVSAVFQILDDGRGAFWLTSNAGLVRVARASLEAVLDGRATRLEAELFGKADGMGTDQCNGNTQPAGARLRDGRLAIPTAGGLTLVDPADLHRNTVPPPVLLGSVVVDGQRLAPGTRTLPWTSERFEFHYDGLSLLQPERVTFRYRVDGLDRDWVDAGSRRVALYNSLPPGRRTFRVEARNNDGVWSTAEASVSFVLPAPPWQRWWAYAGYAGLAGLLLFGIVRLRERVLESRNALLERKVQERTAELNATLSQLGISEARAVEASRAKTVFLANMSHELRTPLNAVLGFAQLLERDPALSARNREELGIIHRSGEHLLGLINDVLSLSKIETGHLERLDRPFRLPAMLQAVQDIVRVRAEAKDLDLAFRLDPSLPQAVLSDEGKLRQVLINLLGNAVKFTRKGGVTLEASWKDGRGTFAITDTGPGISEEEVGRLFRPFSQTETGRRAQEGTGLGLVISRQIVQLLGGDIRVKSRVGEGTTFSFDVDLPVTAEALEPVKRRPRVTGLAPGQGPVRILAVDDVAANRLLLSRVLSLAGFEVREAVNGAQALEEIDRYRPHLVFMDMRMPVMDGREATRRIREREKAGAQHTFIVSLTASALEHERNDLLEGGTDDVLTKPFVIEDLFEVIERRLGVRFRTEEETPQAEAGAPPAVDLAAGLVRAGGDEVFYRRLLSRFVGELGELVPKLQQLQRGASREELHRALHTARGNAATLGLNLVAREVAALEARPEAELNLAALAAAIENARVGTADFLSRDGGSERTGPDAFDPSEALGILERLSRHLATNDLASANDVLELTEVLPASFSTALRELDAHLDQLDFAAAQTALRAVEARLHSSDHR